MRNRSQVMRNTYIQETHAAAFLTAIHAHNSDKMTKADLQRLHKALEGHMKWYEEVCQRRSPRRR